MKGRIARAGLCLAGFLTLAAAPRAHACDVCTTFCPADDPDMAASKGLQLGMAEQFTHSGTVRLGETEVSNRADQYLSSSATRFFLSYTMSDKLDLQLHLPFIHRAFRRFQGVTLDEGTLTGLGDVTMMSGLTVARKSSGTSSFRLKALGGLKLPTGSTEVFDELDPNNPHGADGAFPDPKDAVHPHQLALGTGSLDLVLGADVWMTWNRVSLAAAAQFSNPLLTRDDFRPGESLNWLVSGGFSVLDTSNLDLTLRAGLSGELKRADFYFGVEDPYTRMSYVLAGPAIAATWKAGVSAELGLGLPLHFDSGGASIAPDYRLRLGLSWRI